MVLYIELSDTELVDLLKSGNRAAFTEIFNRYQSLLYIFAYKKIGDREEAKDLIHELFLTFWEKRELLNISCSLPAYLFTVLKNRVFDLYKHKKVSQRYLETFQTYLDTEQNATDYLVRHNELSCLIEKEIASLPYKMREVFELSRKTNLSRKEIATELNLSEQTVKSHMHHALKILKTKLGPMVILVL
ncbi:RNA polymerase sigma-70 factor [Pedobacter hiemivivus]|jgi:RNA polymerase sigma-70 factor (family 1)|uniref:RNA polymerase sigma-70 factor n=1 Tax=Pedobacter hiemivivus TaxID=2530454 RepID=A0A4R0ML81_9SPHI|nr:RNA polymerase sigma-70 factor [Pedobacter hiemivivus]TCC87410.1 RNA polymerase sigma-70 factor [Pedobacter hiemivivus]TKC63967.1 RNA polymerase sigma-70 factor [Pedobacter hiemivivus]